MKEKKKTENQIICGKCGGEIIVPLSILSKLDTITICYTALWYLW